MYLRRRRKEIELHQTYLFWQGVANAQIDNPSAIHTTTNNTKFVQNSFVNVTAIVCIIITKEF